MRNMCGDGATRVDGYLRNTHGCTASYAVLKDRLPINIISQFWQLIKNEKKIVKTLRKQSMKSIALVFSE